MKSAVEKEEIDRVVVRLLASTHRIKRPQSLVKIAQDVRTLISARGSVARAADELSLSESMLRRFLLVNRLVPKLLALVEERRIDSIDAVAELSSLNAKQQNKFAVTFRKQPLSTADIRGVVRLLRNDKSSDLEDIVQKVLESRTRRLYVYEFVVRESGKDSSTLRSRFETVLPGQMIDTIEVKGSLGRIKVDADGKRLLGAAARSRHTNLTRLVQEVANGN